MKYFIFVALCIVMWLLTACGGTNVEVQPTTDHILTILARSTYEGPIRQAEQALIAEWSQRPDKEGHSFTLELTTFHPDDETNHLTRLDTILMAGQAYDIFFPVADHRHVRDYAISGFVTDFYPLIDNCPFTSRDDFFTNALQAWENDGGLYVFPWDFSFSFAFINSVLPQSLRNQFAAHNIITVAELVDIYWELLYYYSHDFGHFNFSHGSTLHHPSRTMASSLGTFVNFEDKTASVTDETFVTFLTDFATVFDARHLLGQDRPYWTNWWVVSDDFPVFQAGFSPHSLRMITGGASNFTWGTGWLSDWKWGATPTMTMQPNAFMVESRGFFSAAAVTFDNVFAPYFDPGILLADEEGRLLIGNDSSYPSGIAISSGANGAIAWDFTRHLVNAFNRREMHSFYSLFYDWSVAIPIVRDLFEFRVHTSLVSVDSFYRGWRMFSIWPPDSLLTVEWMNEQASLRLPYIYAWTEMPMALTRPPIPEHLYIDNLELLLRGLITPQDFAQRTQNAVSLWLIGG